MSYLSPTKWDDVDAGGNALDWSSRTNKLLYPAYEMLRMAIVERCNGSETSVPSSLSSALAPTMLISRQWKADFEATITALIPKFADHTQVDVNYSYDGLASIPMWTEAAILTEIGAASRLPCTYHYSADWEIQQYQILNLLRWHSPRGMSWSNDPSFIPETTYQHQYKGFSSSWAAFLADTWADGYFDYLMLAGDGSRWRGQHNKWTIRNRCNIPCIAKCYGRLSQYDIPASIGKFTHSYPNVNSLQNLMIPGTVGAEVSTDFLISDTEYAAFSPPSGAIQLNEPMNQIVFSFACENGFQFRNFPTEYPPI